MPPIPLYHVWQYTDIDREFWRDHIESWLPRKIFDAHTHVANPEFRLVEMSDEKRRQYWVNEVNEPIAASDAARCHEIVYPGRNFSCLAFADPSLDSDIEANNDYLETECSRHGWHRLAIILPQWSAERVARELDQPRTIGVKVYYTLIGNDPLTRDRYLEASIFEFLPHHQLELLNERGSWVTLHVPKAGRLCHPDNLREVQEIRQKYPQIKLIIAHLGRCYTLPHAKQAFPVLAGDEGLYFDVCAVFNPDVLQLAMETFGPSRILYGTDNPLFYMRGRQTWRDTAYMNHTDYPFYYNQDREPPEIEAKYTLYLYEALRAIKQAGDAAGWNGKQMEAIFHDNARGIIDNISKGGK
jgi:predicted TIM-barrel fold metal-dependent hydrolase